MVTIQLEDRTADALKARAQARGLSLEAYLRLMAENGSQEEPAARGDAGQAAREFDAALDDLFADDMRKLPEAPLTYSREDIYFDHD